MHIIYNNMQFVHIIYLCTIGAQHVYIMCTCPKILVDETYWTIVYERERKTCHNSSRIVHITYTSHELCQTIIYGREKDVSREFVTRNRVRDSYIQIVHIMRNSRTLSDNNIWARERRVTRECDISLPDVERGSHELYT